MMLHPDSVICAGEAVVKKPLWSLSHCSRRARRGRSKLPYHERCHKGNKQDRMGNSVVVKDLRGRNTQAKTWRVLKKTHTQRLPIQNTQVKVFRWREE